MRIYIAGPYTVGDTAHNIETARECLVKLIEQGHTPFCPHTMLAGLENNIRLGYDDFMRVDLEWLDVCDAICLLPGWRESPGSIIEHGFAFGAHMIIYEWRDGQLVGRLHIEEEEDE